MPELAWRTAWRTDPWLGLLGPVRAFLLARCGYNSASHLCVRSRLTPFLAAAFRPLSDPRRWSLCFPSRLPRPSAPFPRNNLWCGRFWKPKYERGELRLNANIIVKLAQILGISTDELLGAKIRPKRQEPPVVFRDKRLRKRIQMIDQLSKRDREALIRTIDAFIAKAPAKKAS